MCVRKRHICRPIVTVHSSISNQNCTVPSLHFTLSHFVSLDEKDHQRGRFLFYFIELIFLPFAHIRRHLPIFSWPPVEVSVFLSSLCVPPSSSPPAFSQTLDPSFPTFQFNTYSFFPLSLVVPASTSSAPFLIKTHSPAHAPALFFSALSRRRYNFDEPPSLSLSPSLPLSLPPLASVSSFSLSHPFSPLSTTPSPCDSSRLSHPPSAPAFSLPPRLLGRQPVRSSTGLPTRLIIPSHPTRPPLHSHNQSRRLRVRHRPPRFHSVSRPPSFTSVSPPPPP